MLKGDEGFEITTVKASENNKRNQQQKKQQKKQQQTNKNKQTNKQTNPTTKPITTTTAMITIKTKTIVVEYNDNTLWHI